MTLPDDNAALHGTCDWPHAPPHRLESVFVTARTLNRVLHFHSPERLSFVRDKLLSLAAQYGWKLEAWAVMANHYHFVAHSPTPEHSGHSLSKFIRHLHGDVTRFVNRDDGMPGRTLWHNYRETHLLFRRGYMARLNYTHNNPVHHRIAGRARDYEWCSAHAFEQSCTHAWVNTVYSFKFDEIVIADGDGD
jgi:putative transposase